MPFGSFDPMVCPPELSIRSPEQQPLQVLDHFIKRFSQHQPLRDPKRKDRIGNLSGVGGCTLFPIVRRYIDTGLFSTSVVGVSNWRLSAIALKSYFLG